MPPICRHISRFIADESASTAIEYGLIAAGIFLAIVTVVQQLGTELLRSKFEAVRDALATQQ